MDPKYLCFVPEPLSYHFCIMARFVDEQGIVRHQTVPGWLGEVALGGCVGTILYSWLCS